MDTIGNLFDRLCILEKRKEVLKQDHLHNYEVINDLEEQRGWIVTDMARIIKAIKDGEHPGTMRKNKIYDPDVGSFEEINNLIELIHILDNITRKLWELEDLRRDTDNFIPEDRLELADKVSVWNKKRNNIIDRIDEVMLDSIERVIPSENFNIRR